MGLRLVSERGGLRLSVALVVFLLAAASCSRDLPPAPLQVSVHEGDSGAPASVLVTGLSSSEIRALGLRSEEDPDVWQQVMRVTVAGGEQIPIAGSYHAVVDAGRLEFRPRFPLDRGRDYAVRVDPTKLPVPRQSPPIEQTVRLTPAPAGAPTRVTGISPRAAVWPENLLRFYIHFSGPMSRSTALEFVALVDDHGTEVTEAFLPLDVDLWNPDHTRFTVFFDPGRVKRGIRPNVEKGRALIAGGKYAIKVDARWPDAAGLPLASSFRHAFTAGPAEERAIEPKHWTLASPPAGSREALVVGFPWPLDHELLQRAIGVAVGSDAVDGVATAGEDDRSWRFVPTSPWRAGAHDLVVLTLLEDPAGNRVGRPFEIEMFKSPLRETRDRVSVPFLIKP